MQKPLSDVPGLTSRIVKMLAKEGIERVADVVQMLPFRHEDRRRMDALAFQAGDAPGCHFVRVAKTHVKFFGRRRGAGVFEAVVEHVDDNVLGQQLTLRWWNMPFMSKSIATDMELVVYGRIKEFKGKLFMDHPEYEIIRGGEDDDSATIHTGRIAPVYRLRGGLTQKAVRTAAWCVMEMLDDRFIDDLLPLPSTKGEYAGWHRSRALHTIHFPATMEELTRASRYLALEEFYAYQVRVVRRRRSAIAAGGKSHAGDNHLLHAFLGGLPFDLTGAQKRSLGEIRRDMASAAPMNRLLHGDVGSGKTVVALAAMLAAIECGSQAALMAPTQILAEQHFLTAQKWLAPLGVRVRLRLGSTGGPPVDFGGPPKSSSASERTDGREGALTPSGATDDAAAPSPHAEKLKDSPDVRTVVSLRDELGGPPNSTGGPPVLPETDALRALPELLIGTHALLYDRAAVHNLGFVVIDEQHKFGVAQRARLIEKGNTPDVLVMTATPIPRTLTLTIYGDLDVSTIDERPKARGKIVTKVRPQTKVTEAAAFLREQIEQGRQGYLVFPLIEDSEKLDAAAAKKGHAQWSELLKPHSVGLLHGKLSAEEKELVMREFREGKTSALVSTTVIEVGVDVPNATVMYVHNAERFGLAQLHQLRGRIGRGSHTSYCVLFIKEEDDETKQRLAILEETDDGFVIAEEDLKRRGPGDVLGREQSGQAPLRFAELLADTRLVRLARQLAERTLDADPQLTAPQHAELRKLAMDLDSPHATRQ